MSNIQRRAPLWRNVTLSSGTEKSLKIGVSGIVQSVQIIWHDATSAFTVALYSSNLDDPDVPADGSTPDLEQWVAESGVSITGAAGTAAGSSMTHLGNQGARHLLLMFDPSANSDVSVRVHERD